MEYDEREGEYHGEQSDRGQYFEDLNAASTDAASVEDEM